MKKLIATLVLIAAPLSAFAMPEGSLDCTSKDGKWTASFEILNYGEQELVNVFEMVLDGKSENTKLVKISRQWVDMTTANVDVALPNGKSFSRDLIFETKMSDPSNNQYTGTVRIEARDDYDMPEKVVMKTDMTCVWNP